MACPATAAKSQDAGDKVSSFNMSQLAVTAVVSHDVEAVDD